MKQTITITTLAVGMLFCIPAMTQMDTPDVFITEGGSVETGTELVTEGFLKQELEKIASKDDLKSFASKSYVRNWGIIVALFSFLGGILGPDLKTLALKLIANFSGGGG